MKKSLPLVAIAIFLPTPAFAYVGPGLGLNAIGMVLGLLLAMFMLILGTIWYPLKSAWKSFRNKPDSVFKVEKTNGDEPHNS